MLGGGEGGAGALSVMMHQIMQLDPPGGGNSGPGTDVVSQSVDEDGVFYIYKGLYRSD